MTIPLSFDALFLANPREYLHKSYLARNQDPWATILSLTVYRQLFKFSSSFVRKPETPIHQLPSQKQILTQNGHSWSFNVIYFGVIEEPLWDYIAKYNNCGLRWEVSEDMAGEISENRHFRGLHSHLKLPRQRTPSNIRTNLTLLESAIPWLHFCR